MSGFPLVTLGVTAFVIAGCDWGGHLPAKHDAPLEVSPVDTSDDSDAIFMDAAITDVTSIDCATVTPALTIGIVSGCGSISGYCFAPDPAMLHSGEVVRFDTAPDHDLTVTPPNMQIVATGGVGCFQFPPGTYVLSCTYHAFTGQLMVQ